MAYSSQSDMPALLCRSIGRYSDMTRPVRKHVVVNEKAAAKNFSTSILAANTRCDAPRSNIRRNCTRSGRRSEEHTSELQSLMRISYAVFCLKKKTKKQHRTVNTNYNHHNM